MLMLLPPAVLAMPATHEKSAASVKATANIDEALARLGDETGSVTATTDGCVDVGTRVRFAGWCGQIKGASEEECAKFYSINRKRNQVVLCKFKQHKFDKSGVSKCEREFTGKAEVCKPYEYVAAGACLDAANTHAGKYHHLYGFGWPNDVDARAETCWDKCIEKFGVADLAGIDINVSQGLRCVCYTLQGVESNAITHANGDPTVKCYKKKEDTDE